MDKEQKSIERERKGEFDLRPVPDDATFRFSCHPGIPCFNACCHQIEM